MCFGRDELNCSCFDETSSTVRRRNRKYFMRKKQDYTDTCYIPQVAQHLDIYVFMSRNYCMCLYRVMYLLRKTPGNVNESLFELKPVEHLYMVSACFNWKYHPHRAGTSAHSSRWNVSSHDNLRFGSSARKICLPVSPSSWRWSQKYFVGDRWNVSFQDGSRSCCLLLHNTRFLCVCSDRKAAPVSNSPFYIHPEQKQHNHPCTDEFRCLNNRNPILSVL